MNDSLGNKTCQRQPAKRMVPLSGGQEVRNRPEARCINTTLQADASCCYFPMSHGPPASISALENEKRRGGPRTPNPF